MSVDRVRPAADEGTALVMVLVFVLVVGVLVGALLQQSYTVLRSGRASTTLNAGVFAADGGVDWAIQQLRNGVLIDGSPACAGPEVGVQDLPGSIVVNARTVTASCEVLDGHTVGAGGWAAYVAGGAGAVTVYAGTEHDKVIDGPVHNAGTFERIGTLPRLLLPSPDLDLCAGPPDTQWVLTPRATPEELAGCAATTIPPAPIDTAAHLDGTGIVDGAPVDPAGQLLDRCHVFAPGRYTAAPSLTAAADGTNYLRSGVYYLDDLGLVTWRDVRVVGGIPAEREAPLTGAWPEAESDCGGRFQTPGDTGGHYGVVLVLGGSTRLEVGSGTSLELFSYVEPDAGGAGSLSVLQLRNEWSTGASTVAATDAVLSTALGSEADVAVHGTVYAPMSRLSAFGTTDSRVSFLGGVVAAGLDLQAGAHEPAVHVGNRTGPGVRTIRLTATANGAGGVKNATTTAIVTIANDAARTTTVTSWTVER